MNPYSLDEITRRDGFLGLATALFQAAQRRDHRVVLALAARAMPGGVELREAIRGAMAWRGKRWPSLLMHADEQQGAHPLPWRSTERCDEGGMATWAAELARKGWPVRIRALWHDGSWVDVDFVTGRVERREPKPAMETLFGEESPL